MMRVRGIPPAGGIPPANRRRHPGPERISSMRAATCLPACAGRRQAGTQDGFRPRVIARDIKEAQARETYRQTMAASRERLRELLAELGCQKDAYLQREAELLERDLRRLGG